MMQSSLFREVHAERLFKYPGSKAMASPYIAKLVPQSVTEMISPFFGGGNFEMYLTGRGIRVHGADLFEPLVNLWNYILLDNEKLCEKIHLIMIESDRETLSEYQKGRYYEITDKFEQAAYFWIFLQMGWNGLPFSGIRKYAVIDNEVVLDKDPMDYTRLYKKLQNFYNPLISINLRDYREHLNLFPNHFTYLDPPYPDVGNLYGSDSSFHEDFDHEELRDILLKRKSLWILSYNDRPIIRDLYDNEDFIVRERWWKQRNNSHKEASELVILPKGMQYD